MMPGFCYNRLTCGLVWALLTALLLACAGCIFSFGSNIPACVACAGCLIGSGVSCGTYCHQTGGYWPGCGQRHRQRNPGWGKTV